MNKKLKIRKFTSLFLIFLLLINNFMSYAGDNDGSAFITKAEFDSLKNTLQSQLDAYNTSIDSKIESAISSYLSGVVTKIHESKTTICYTSDGILAPRPDYADCYWQEGVQNWYIKVTFVRAEGINSGTTTASNNCWTCWGEWNGQPSVSFRDLAIKNVDYAAGTGCWQGWVQDEQLIHGITYEGNPGTGSGGSTESRSYPYGSDYSGFRVASNVDLMNDRTLNIWNKTHEGYDLCWLQYSINKSGTNLGVHIEAPLCRFNRNIVSSKNENVICTPINNNCKKFSNFDGFYDMNNDPDPTGDPLHTHTTIGAGKLNLLFSGGWLESHRPVTTAGSRKLYWDMNFTGTSSHSQAGYNHQMPYVGFVQSITSWSQLWTDKYDNYVADILSYDASTECYTDSNGVKHLWLTAGAPLVFAKKDRIVTMNVDFLDKSVDYDLWLKVGAFKKGTEVTSDTGCIPVSSIYAGDKSSTTNVVSGTTALSIKIPSGSQQISFKMPKDGYIFCKWSLAGNSAIGGGTFLPPTKIDLSEG